MAESKTNRSALAAVLVSLCLTYWLGIFTATHIPLKPLPGGRSRWKSLDKAEHFSAYAGLTVLLCATGAMWVKASPRLFGGVFGLVAVYGAFDELTQLLVPSRSADLRDWVADLAGAGAGILVFAMIHPRLTQSRRHRRDGGIEVDSPTPTAAG